MNTEDRNSVEALAPQTQVLEGGGLPKERESNPKRETEKGTDGHENQHDYSIMVNNLGDGLITEVENTKPYQRHLKGKGWLRTKFTMVLIGGLLSIVLVSSLCIHDQVLVVFGPFNHWLRDHQAAAHHLKLIYTYLIDFSVLFTFTHWILFSSSWKLPFDTLLFFIIRCCCINVIAYRTPENYIWPATKIWSLSDIEADKFQYQMSTFTGSLAISMGYWFTEGKTWAGLASLATVLLSIIAECSFRTAYSTDIFATLVVVHLCAIVNRSWIDSLDAGLNRFLAKSWLRFVKRD